MRVVLPLLAVLPLVMLGSIVAASVERTPVTGRLRIIMLSPEEESELVDGIVGVEGGRDWVKILSEVLQLPEDGRDQMLGGKVRTSRLPSHRY